MYSPKNWILQPTFPEVTQALIHTFQMKPSAAAYLASQKNGDISKAKEFLNVSLNTLHEPFLMKDMQEATERFTDAIMNDEKILVVGDYDVDGMTASSCLLLFLTACHCSNFEVFIPNRFQHGYGLTGASVEQIIDANPQVIVTVDHGVTAFHEVQQLKEHDIEVIITDHHLPDAENPSPDCLVINPNQTGCEYPFKGIAGCGVAFKFLIAVRRYLRERHFWSEERPEPNLKNYLDLVALGTLADMSPLIDENRVFMKHGLELMNQSPRCGLKALFEKKRLTTINAEALAFQICPMLNAAGRMEDGILAVHTLIEQNYYQAQLLANNLHRLNEKRRNKANQMFQIALLEADQQKQHPACVIRSPQFHEGIIGITAAQVMEYCKKPTVVFAESGNSLKGSARSGGRLHLRNAFDACAEYLERFGGHSNAAGCSLPKQNFTQFKSVFYETCIQMSTLEEKPIRIVAVLDISTITSQFVKEFQILEPFGIENPAPIFAIKTPSTPMKPYGKHLCWEVSGITIIGWNMLESYSQFQAKQDSNCWDQMLAVTPKHGMYHQGAMVLQIVDHLELLPLS